MIFKTKRCPRCNFKVDKDANVCPKCRLNYIKFNTATNTEAHEAMSVGEKDRVLLRKGCPSDIKKWKLLLLTIFLGFCGVHHFYVGRKGWGAFYFTFFIVGMINAILVWTFGNITSTWYQLFYLLVGVWGVVVALWIFDIAKVATNRYKIPVSLKN